MIIPCPWKFGQRPSGIEPFRLVICGTRTYENYKQLERVLDRITFWHPITDVWIGGIGTKIERGGEWVWVGADAMGTEWAVRRWHVRKIVWADWKKFSERAGPIRNTKMAKEVAQETNGGKRAVLAAFWDGKSRGTKDMLAKFKLYCPHGRIKIVRF